MSELARLVVPALRWDRSHGFAYLEGLIDDALDLGVGGFVVEGPQAEVMALTERLRSASRHPILVAARAERGAGESVEGLTHLPPFAALGGVSVVPQDGSDVPALDVETVRRAARITVRDLKRVGVNWALAPWCDVEPAAVPRGSGRGASRAAPPTGVRAAPCRRRRDRRGVD
jgi:beta-glucosidase